MTVVEEKGWSLRAGDDALKLKNSRVVRCADGCWGIIPLGCCVGFDPLYALYLRLYLTT